MFEVLGLGHRDLGWAVQVGLYSLRGLGHRFRFPNSRWWDFTDPPAAAPSVFENGCCVRRKEAARL